MDSVKKALSRWLRLAFPLLVSASAAACGTVWDGSLKVGGIGQTFQAKGADLLRYQVGGEREHGPLPVLFDLEALAIKRQDAGGEPGPYRGMPVDGPSGRAHHAQRSALVRESLAELDFDLSVLVPQFHALIMIASAHFGLQPGWLVNPTSGKEATT